MVFVLESAEIRAAFLQAKILDRKLFFKPPEDKRIDGWLWKLKKPLWGLDDDSRNFWLKFRDTLNNLCLKLMIVANFQKVNFTFE